MGTRHVHTVWCSVRAELSSRSLGEGFSLSCVKYAEPWVLLGLPSARRKQRDETIEVGELSALRGMLVAVARNSRDSSVASTLVVASGLRWSCHSFHSAGSKQTCSPCVGLGSDSCCEKSVNDTFCVVGRSDASWACRLEGSSQGGYLIGVTNTSFLEQAGMQSYCVVTWHGGKLARFARSSDAAELQATADAERELTYIRLSLWEIV